MATSQEEIKKLEYDISLSVKILHHELRDVWGHVSARLPGGEGFLIKYLRHPVKETEDPNEISMFDFEGKQLRGTRTPPMELVIHTEMYKSRPDVGSIIHAHPQTVIALTLVNMEILPVHQNSGIFSPKIPLYPNPKWITDAEMMQDIIQFMGQSRAVSLKSHGAITIGADVVNSNYAMVLLEKTAKIQAAGAALGKVTPLPQDLQEQGASRKGLDGVLGVWQAWEEHFKTGKFW